MPSTSASREKNLSQIDVPPRCLHLKIFGSLFICSTHVNLTLNVIYVVRVMSSCNNFFHFHTPAASRHPFGACACHPSGGETGARRMLKEK